MSFEELRLSEPIVRAVAAEGYDTPTAIQREAIPVVLAGKDILGCAQTGTGKTGAFAMPILHRLAATGHGHGDEPRREPGRGRRGGGDRRPIRALILCPTRELAAQIDERFGAYGRHLSLRRAVIFGGVSQHHQERALRNGIDVLTATPGRLLDLMGQGLVDLRSVEVLVLDEADRMLDMGFINDIRKVVAAVPRRRQTLLFSATMPNAIRQLAGSILHEPVPVQVHAVSSTVETVAQSICFVERKHKPALLEQLLRDDSIGRTLVFTRTKHRADRVVRDLNRAGVRAAAIHGNKSQNARTRALDGFRSGGGPRVLVATDIASRGIDVDDITHVINFDMPDLPETYVHRIGRTARAGASGVAISFCDADERQDLAAIERLIGRRLDVMTIDVELASPLGADYTDDRRRDRPVRPSQRQQSASQGRSRKSRSRSRNNGGKKRSNDTPGAGAGPAAAQSARVPAAAKPRQARGIAQRGRRSLRPAGRV